MCVCVCEELTPRTLVCGCVGVGGWVGVGVCVGVGTGVGVFLCVQYYVMSKGKGGDLKEVSMSESCDSIESLRTPVRVL